MEFNIEHTTIDIELKDVTLKGEWSLPINAIGLVIFSHGNGSSRLSPRNKILAKYFQKNGLSTLLFDLLTEEEGNVYENRINIELLTKRLINVTQWMETYNEVHNLPIGYFGASTGIASVLRAAASLKDKITAVVSHGGRPDLTLDVLDQVTASSLLVVGGKDTRVLEFNKKAYQKLTCERRLEIILNATNIFEEIGKLEEVATISANWFVEKMKSKTLDYV